MKLNNGTKQHRFVVIKFILGIGLIREAFPIFALFYGGVFSTIRVLGFYPWT